MPSKTGKIEDRIEEKSREMGKGKSLLAGEKGTTNHAAAWDDYAICCMIYARCDFHPFLFSRRQILTSINLTHKGQIMRRAHRKGGSKKYKKLRQPLSSFCTLFNFAGSGVSPALNCIVMFTSCPTQGVDVVMKN